MTSDDTNGHAAPKWLAQPAYTPTRKMRVVCIGAGFSGLIVAHKVQHELKLEDEIDLAIYERNPDIGGTWYENTYPGAACDVPAHTYVFPFEANPDWSSFYVGQAEILAYMKRTAAKYDLYKHVKLETTIRETIWDEESAKWKIKLEHNDEVQEDEADFLINGAGFLNKWKWPDIPGLDEFQGKLLHTANWDNDYDYTDKKVAVIGNGSSGIQTVTAMQPVVAELVNYMRQPTWIAANVLADKTPNGMNFKYTEYQKRAFRDDPIAMWEYRRELENALNGAFFSMLLGHPTQVLFEEQCKEHMASRMAAAPELAARLAPGYRPGCRRLTPGDGYLEALQQPNCRDSWARITRVTARGLVTTTTTAEGHDEETEEAFDAVVCATGFDSSWLPQWRMVGRGGATLEEQWRDDPVAFFATMVDGFPNYGMVNGPNAVISHGSVLTQMDWTIDFLLNWVMRMNRQDIRTLAVKKDAVADFNEYSQQFLQGTVWAGPCRTLYKNGRTGGRVTGVYAGSMGHFREGLDAVGGEHFDMTWNSPNRFRCLGNGQVATDLNGAGDLAPYMARPLGG